jgi:prepilin-type N-terminal cleavage/methylation domain-containing protein
MKTIAGTKLFRRRAFTLIELLVVISVIGLLAALTVPVIGAIKRTAFINRARAEMSQLETAIERYKAAYGFYPPDSTNTVNNVPLNQLFYELVGTSTTNNGASFQSLDGSFSLTTANAQLAFGTPGFMNCLKPGADESSARGKSFLTDLKPNQIATINGNGADIKILIASVGGPDAAYKPMGQPDINPWRYVAQGVNNPGGYDLWVQLSIRGKNYLICNWNKRPQINSPLP